MVNGIDIVNTAKKFLGVKYIFGGSSPSGFDCSGLVYYVYKSNGINISRTTKTQINEGTEISRDNLQPGDLVFPNPDHVAIYIGNNQIIHAPQTGKNVEISNLYKFWRARRILSNISFISFFDSNLYNFLYEDLKKAFNGDKNKLYNHYISFGIKEGRICSYIYDPFYYQNCNEDLMEIWKVYLIIILIMVLRKEGKVLLFLILNFILINTMTLKMLLEMIMKKLENIF